MKLRTADVTAVTERFAHVYIYHITLRITLQLQQALKIMAASKINDISVLLLTSVNRDTLSHGCLKTTAIIKTNSVGRI